MAKPVRTRFAPSPTGKMHVGNLRTALYEYLIARSLGGSFILRVEDTDQKRQDDQALALIYQTLAQVGLDHDEGPDIGGPYGPYTQSERLPLYRKYAQQLLTDAKAYRCFCPPERLEALKTESNQAFTGYDRHCRDLDAAKIAENLSNGLPYVIRQKMPLSGETTFDDVVYGSITVANSELEDQILLKSDGYPTYNFANVVDDHLMQISHVVRGSEYLSSTPKYNLLYEAFGWEIPTYIHLPLILGEDGSKLAKRHGATSFAELVRDGYLPEAIVNAIALLGWSPPDNRELFSLAQLRTLFSAERISKSPAVFDFAKLDWFNTQYLRQMDAASFLSLIRPSLDAAFAGKAPQVELLADLLKSRLVRLTKIPEMVNFLVERQPYNLDLFDQKKTKASQELARQYLPQIIETLNNLADWQLDSIKSALADLAAASGLKTGQIMWPLRIALSGQTVTPGGAVEIALILGRTESIERLQLAARRLSANDEREDNN